MPGTWQDSLPPPPVSLRCATTSWARRGSLPTTSSLWSWRPYPHGDRPLPAPYRPSCHLLSWDGTLGLGEHGEEVVVTVWHCRKRPICPGFRGPVVVLVLEPGQSKRD